MESTERLAAYLAGDLPPGQRAAVDADLARDPKLAAQLEAMRRADAALAGLRSPEPGAGFDARLHAAVDRELDDVLGSADVVAIGRRQRWSWPAAVAAAAAGIVAIAGVGLVVAQQQPPSDDTVALADPDVDEPELHVAEDDGAATTDALRGPQATVGLAGPTVILGERDLSQGDLEELVDAPELRAVASAELSGDDARALATRWREILEEGPTEPGAAQADEGPRTLAEPDEAEAADAWATVLECLDAVEGDPPALVAYSETARFDDRDVVVFGLVVANGDDDSYTDREVLVLAADGCVPLASATAD